MLDFKLSLDTTHPKDVNIIVLIAVLLFAVGVVLIIKGGDVFVDAATWTSDVTGISKVVIGATVVSLATTSPEYFVSLLATLKGANDLSIGNAVGSLICNIGLAFALLALFTAGRVHDKLFGAKGFIMLISTIVLWLFCLNGLLSMLEGIVLMLLFCSFVFVNIRFSKTEEKSNRKKTNKKEIVLNVIKFVAGAFAIVYGSNLIVDNGRRIAEFIGVSDAVIGLTVVAIGTSLPEITTSIAAIVKKESALSIGNILGANALDATLILATGSFVSGGKLTVSQNTVWMELPLAILLMLMAVLPTAIGKKLYRWQGAMILILFALFLTYIALFRV